MVKMLKFEALLKNSFTCGFLWYVLRISSDRGVNKTPPSWTACAPITGLLPAREVVTIFKAIN